MVWRDAVPRILWRARNSCNTFFEMHSATFFHSGAFLASLYPFLWTRMQSFHRLLSCTSYAPPLNHSFMRANVHPQLIKYNNTSAHVEIVIMGLKSWENDTFNSTFLINLSNKCSFYVFCVCCSRYFWFQPNFLRSIKLRFKKMSSETMSEKAELLNVCIRKKLQEIFPFSILNSKEHVNWWHNSYILLTSVKKVRTNEWSPQLFSTVEQS